MKIVIALIFVLLPFGVYSQDLSIGSTISISNIDDSHTYKGVYGASLNLFVEKEVYKNISVRPELVFSYLSDRNNYDSYVFNDKRTLTGFNLNFQYNFPSYNPYKRTTYHVLSGVGFVNYKGESSVYNIDGKFNKINKNVIDILLNFGLLSKTKLDKRVSLVNMLSYSASDNIIKNINTKPCLFNYDNRNEYMSNINISVGLVYDLYNTKCYKQ